MEPNAEGDDAACRAEIPPMLSQEERDALVFTPQCQQRWGERRDGGAALPPKAEDIEEFLKEFARLKETELALQCLFEGKFDVPKAVGLLRAARRQRYKARRDRDERLPAEEFKNAVTMHGKKFHLVKKAIGRKVITREVVSKYYLWKRTPEFREWRLRQTAKKTKKTKKETKLLRQWGEDSDEDSETKPFVGYHNERCELCATGGKLLCCSGCARAYHFCCVQPPITKIPRHDEDWFCAHCQKVLGGPKPKLVGNEYGFACAPFPGVACSLSTDLSSYEDEDDLYNSVDEGDGDEGAGSEFNDELASDHGSNTSESPRAEEQNSNAGNSRSLTDNESDSTGVKVPSSSPGAASTGSESGGLVQQSSPAESSPAQKQQQHPEEELQPTGQSSDSSHRSVELSVESSPGVKRLPPVQLDRPSSGRKRNRKMLAPRRIPPSRFDG
ncbi:hypothetical protein PF008_g2386 [Phytophthora fragariae]|uniref:PHD-type domain-containing protein n=1 Tax=Phytophthora fragariae TaxID=53985 RepID=A0A6G0SJ70_9STRA|nr:hypothetical protein PF008_g2386 [Phytophthora fragariae]